MSLFGAIAQAGDTITNLGWNIGSTLYNDYRSRKSIAQSQSYEREMAEWQNQKNLEFWHLNNEYNTPANQMKRFQEAGLNPNLIYGNGTASAGNSSSPVSSSKPGSVDFSRPLLNPNSNPLGGSFDAVVALRNLDNQTMLAASQADFNRAKQRDAEAAASLKDVQSLRELFKYGIDKDVRDALVAQHFANVANTRANTWTTEQQGFNAISNTKLNEQRINESIANTDLLKSKLKMQPLEAALLSTKIDSLSEQIVSQQFGNKLNSATYYAQVEKIKNIALDSFYRAENGRINFNKTEFEYTFEKTFGHKIGEGHSAVVSAYFQRMIGTLYGDSQFVGSYE